MVPSDIHSNFGDDIASALCFCVYKTDYLSRAICKFICGESGPGEHFLEPNVGLQWRHRRSTPAFFCKLLSIFSKWCQVSSRYILLRMGGVPSILRAVLQASAMKHLILALSVRINHKVLLFFFSCRGSCLCYSWVLRFAGKFCFTVCSMGAIHMCVRVPSEYVQLCGFLSGFQAEVLLLCVGGGVFWLGSC